MPRSTQRRRIGFGDVAQRKRFRHRRARPGDLAGDIVVRVGELLGQPVEAVGFFKRRQVLALQIFDQCQLERFGVVGDLFDAGQLRAGPPRARRGNGARRR